MKDRLEIIRRAKERKAREAAQLTNLHFVDAFTFEGRKAERERKEIHEIRREEERRGRQWIS